MSNDKPAWTTRVWQEFRAGNLSRGQRDVLLCLHSFRGTGGVAWPSHATLADRAKCCTRTVARALAQAQALSLVSWAERRVRAGWRWLRTSNRYRFAVPEGPITAAPWLKHTTGLRVRIGESLRKKEARDDRQRGGEGHLPDLLAARRAAWTAGLVGIVAAAVRRG
jgi:hypothetical protein